MLCTRNKTVQKSLKSALNYSVVVDKIGEKGVIYVAVPLIQNAVNR